MAEKDDKINWSSLVNKALSGIVIAWLGVNEYKGDPTGDFISYKDWASKQIAQLNIDLTDTRIEVAKLSGKRETEARPANQFRTEWQYGILLQRNTVTSQLFYDHPTQGRRHAFLYPEDRKVAYLDISGKRLWITQ